MPADELRASVESTLQVRVDERRCQGHTLCAMIAPQVFELDDVDGHAHAVSGDVPTELRIEASDAARSCPEQAIVITAAGGAP